MTPATFEQRYESITKDLCAIVDRSKLRVFVPQLEDLTDAAITLDNGYKMRLIASLNDFLSSLSTSMVVLEGHHLRRILHSMRSNDANHLFVLLNVRDESIGYLVCSAFFDNGKFCFDTAYKPMAAPLMTLYSKPLLKWQKEFAALKQLQTLAL